MPQSACNKPDYIRQLTWSWANTSWKDLQRTELQLYTNNITRFISILVLLSTRIQDHQLNTIISVSTLSQVDDLKSPNKPLSLRAIKNPNQYLLLIISPSTNTQYVPTNSTTTLALVPSTSTSSYVTKTALDSTINALFAKLSDNFDNKYKELKSMNALIANQDKNWQ